MAAPNGTDPIDEIFQLARSEVSALAQSRKYLLIFGQVLIPVAVGLIFTFRAEFDAINANLFWILILTCVVLQSLMIFYTARSPQLVQEAYFLARPLHQNYERSVAEAETYKQKILYLSVLQEIIFAWNIMLLRYHRDAQPSAGGLGDEIGKILSLIVFKREDLFGFRAGEFWNFAVYLFDPQENVLRPVWRDKHPSHPSTGDARVWRPGEGHVGKAFIERKALITADATLQEVAQFLAAPMEKARPHDDTAYKALASFPIEGVAESGEAAGVIVATSDRIGRFDRVNSLVLNHAAAVLANVIAWAPDIPDILSSNPPSGDTGGRGGGA